MIFCLELGIWSLVLIWVLEFVIWNLCLKINISAFYKISIVFVLNNQYISIPELITINTKELFSNIRKLFILQIFNT